MTHQDLVNRMKRLQCCGLVEYSGLEHIRSKKAAEALRRAAYRFGRSGMVIATVTPRVMHARKHLVAAGFKSVEFFTNPRTNRTVRVYMAPTIKTTSGELHNQREF